MGVVCSKTMWCRACGTALANHGGAAGFVSYSHRTMLLARIAAVKCSCGCEQNLESTCALPHDWKQLAQRIQCPTQGCAATLGYRVGELVIVSFQKRVYVCHGLLYVECNQCKCIHERGKGL